MRHIKEVHMGTRFKCEKCPYETSRNYLLKKHVKAKHPETIVEDIIAISGVEKESPEIRPEVLTEVKSEIFIEDFKLEEF